MPLALLTLAGAGVLDTTVTMYHVNPQRFGPIPRNTDAADVTGDLFFQLFEVLTVPLACSDPTVPSWRKPFECRNLETTDPSDVVNKVTLRVDSNYSAYAMCNIGNAQGKDPLGRPCPVGGYCCYCSEYVHGHFPRTVPCNATVGYQNLKGHFGPAQMPWHHSCSKDYDCWTSHAAAKLTDAHPGIWYSPLEAGDCSLHPDPSPNCTWAVHSVEKIVNATCQSDSFFAAVQRAAPAPFANCSSAATGKANASDACWIRAFYTAVLGPDASKPNDWKVTGIPIDDLIQFWSAPFESDDPAKGGCPGLPIPPLAALQAQDMRRAAGEEAHTPPAPPSPRQRRREAFARHWRAVFGGEKA